MNQSDSPTSPPNPDVAREPFACPHCGQMLAASCRVCVACKQAVEPPQVAPPPPPAATPAEPGPMTVAAPAERVRYPWTLFLLVLAVAMAGATAVQRLMNPQKGQLVLYGAQMLTAVWVFFDAQAKRLPKALRWSLGTLLLWLVIFPWYLARRSKPAARCPFVEGPAGPLTRALLVILLLVLFILAFQHPPVK